MAKKFIVYDVDEIKGEFKIKGDVHPDNYQKGSVVFGER